MTQSNPPVANQIAGNTLQWFGNMFSLGGSLIPGVPGKLILGLHGLGINAMGGVLENSGYQSSSLEKLVIGGALSTMAGLAVWEVGTLALTALAVSPGAVPILAFGAAAAAMVGSGEVLDEAFKAYDDWKKNGGPATLEQAISDFAISAGNGIFEIEQGIHSALTQLYSAITSALDSMAQAFDGTLGSISGLLNSALEGLGLEGGISALGSILGGFFSGLMELLPDWLLPGALNPIPVDPLVIDLGGNGIDLISVADSNVNMDMDGNGYAERIAWVAPSDGLLAIDRNGNGTIDGLSELFGNATTDGFVALKALDSNNDNKINASDTQFANLRVWVDTNGDGIAQAGEVNTLAHHGITEISLSKTTVNQFIDGTRIEATASVTSSAGGMSIGSVYFARETLLSEWVAPPEFEVSTAASKLPGLKGYGDVKNLNAAMTLDEDLLDLAQELVEDAEAMTGAQIKSAFEAILYKWADVESVSPTGRGAHVNGQHLAVIEKFYGTTYLETFFNGSTATNPTFVYGPGLEKLYANMLGSMLLQFMGQVAISQAILADDPEVMTDSIFWPLAMLSEGTELGLASALSLITEGAPADGAKDAYFERLFTVLAKGAAVNIYSGNDAAAKAGFANIADPVIAHWLGAYLDGYVSAIGTTSGTTMTGTTGNDLLIGLAGNDTLQGGNGHDILIGGEGDDYLQGGNGNDTYYYRIGDGHDTIADIGNWTGNADHLILGEELTRDKLTISVSGGSMILTFAGVTGSVTMLETDAISERGIEWVTFGDGEKVSRDTLQGMYIEQQEASGAVTITGFGNRNDHIHGNSQDNILQGGAGNDTYYYNIGDGHDTIADIGNWTGNDDHVMLGAGLNSSNVSIAMSGTSMILTFAGITGSLTLLESDAGSDRGIERVTFGNGEIWTRDDFFREYIRKQETAGNITINGTSRDDVIYGNSANNQLNGGVGNDTYHFGPGSGNDTINENGLSMGNADQLIFGNGMTTSLIQITTSGANLTISFTGVAGSVTLTSQDALSYRGIESFTFSAENVVWSKNDMFAAYIAQEQNAGAATINGFSTVNDTIIGSNINNTLNGKGGNDIIYGMGGNDTIYGEDGDDVLFGGDGNDAINGGAHADTINGGSGNDILTGGTGNDVFVFDALNNGADTITDFTNNQDKIDLKAMGITYSGLTITAVGSDVRIIKTGSTDLDVTLKNFALANVDASDFIFV